jgi:hypothetical protein
MTKRAVKNQFDVFVNEMIDGAYDAIRPWGIIGPRSLPGNRILKFLLKPVLQNEISHYRVSYNHQFQLMTDLAEDIANGQGDFDEYRDDVIAFDYFYQNHRGTPEDKELFESALEDRYLTIAEDVAPLVASDEDDFWDAMKDSYDKQEARKLLRHNFDYASILKDHKEHIRLWATWPWIDVSLPPSYTGEALVALDESESALRKRLLNRVEKIY